MLPLVVGIFSTSISGGQIMVADRPLQVDADHRRAVVVGGALFAFSRLAVDTPTGRSR